MPSYIKEKKVQLLHMKQGTMAKPVPLVPGSSSSQAVSHKQAPSSRSNTLTSAHRNVKTESAHPKNNTISSTGSVYD